MTAESKQTEKRVDVINRYAPMSFAEARRQVLEMGLGDRLSVRITDTQFHFYNEVRDLERAYFDRHFEENLALKWSWIDPWGGPVTDINFYVIDFLKGEELFPADDFLDLDDFDLG